ncbi:MAG TPA: MFS transporter [Nitrospirales bacterium]|nr:MFS transporter [Nitrospirales bacterium]
MPSSTTFSKSTLFAISYLLLTVLFFKLGDGLQGILVPIRAQMEGFSLPSIGLLGTAFYSGLVIGCLFVPTLIQRVGHIRVFSGFAALAATAFLLHDFVTTVPVWLGLRMAIGFCFAGLYMAIESWLNDQATTHTRGRILGTYMLVSWVAVIGGKLLFAFMDPVGVFPFALVSMGICLAVVPVAFGTGPAPAPATEKPLRLRKLYRISPVGMVGSLSIGITNGAFWALAPIYAQSRGLAPLQIGLFMSAAVLGGALTQWPLGRWSDWIDRRRIIAGSCLTAALAAGALAMADQSHELIILILALVFGAGALPLYALCLAHANDFAPPESFIQVSRDLLMVFGFGAIVGPYLGAWFMTIGGPLGLFLFTGSIHLALTAYTLIRIWQRPPVPETEKTAFVSIPRTTQAILTLDPRSEETGRMASTQQIKGE